MKYMDSFLIGEEQLARVSGKKQWAALLQLLRPPKPLGSDVDSKAKQKIRGWVLQKLDLLLICLGFGDCSNGHSFDMIHLSQFGGFPCFVIVHL